MLRPVENPFSPLTPKHGFPSLLYKTQGAPPQSASPFPKIKNTGEYLMWYPPATEAILISYGGIIHIRLKGRR